MAYRFGAVLALLSFNAFSADPFWSQGVSTDSHEITVYRSESCGCCKAWLDHLEHHNFEVRDITVNDINPYKEKMNVPPQAASCHTAVIDGVVIEGHVPAQDIRKVLADQGTIRLLTVPGMVSGSPGMDAPGAPKQAFKVFALHDNDEVTVFSDYQDY